MPRRRAGHAAVRRRPTGRGLGRRGPEQQGASVTGWDLTARRAVDLRRVASALCR
ncbi:putative leader peptide [Cellulomonas sp. GbtcB1]|uniref:putative leader peptide n=1 Tax=Cellulomonas sp. GbtcB1 TaxID=2824746 RepID=UPI0034D477AB